MTRDEAYEMASQQGFEGQVFASEIDADCGPVETIRITLTGDDGETSLWVAEVSRANGCESFGEWTAETRAFHAEQMAIAKASKKSRRKTTKV